MEWKEEQVKMQTLVIGLNKKPGFTLIELLIVIVIIGIMSSILLLNNNELLICFWCIHDNQHIIKTYIVNI